MPYAAKCRFGSCARHVPAGQKEFLGYVQPKPVAMGREVIFRYCFEILMNFDCHAMVAADKFFNDGRELIEAEVPGQKGRQLESQKEVAR